MFFSDSSTAERELRGMPRINDTRSNVLSKINNNSISRIDSQSNKSIFISKILQLRGTLNLEVIPLDLSLLLQTDINLNIESCSCFEFSRSLSMEIRKDIAEMLIFSKYLVAKSKEIGKEEVKERHRTVFDPIIIWS